VAIRIFKVLLTCDSGYTKIINGMVIDCRVGTVLKLGPVHPQELNLNTGSFVIV
jgi:hypothetical protein